MNTDSIIKWIVNNGKLEQSDYFYDYNSGSVLSYCLKYNNNLTKLFLTKEIIDECIDVNDEFEMICPYSDFGNSGKIKMNLIQIAAIVDSNTLNMIIKLNKKKSNTLLKEHIATNDFNHNILHVALFNNPESIQIILNLDMFNTAKLKETEEAMGGFEKVIEIQPASWYYLQESLKNYPLKMNTDEHWYGYTYKTNFKKENIKKITHYILGTQEVTKNRNNICDICDTYKRKVVFTKCRHKVCIVCAVHSDKCGTCRQHLNDDEKILM
jgi:hypothetical protein